MPSLPLLRESARQRNFYTPEFQVRIEGVGLPQNVLRDVIELTYRDSIKEIDSFELTVNNWDASNRSFKYSGNETAQSLIRNPLHRLFEPCNKKVEVRIGYAGLVSGGRSTELAEPQVMVRGNFTTMEPNFTGGGASTLTVRGLNVLHELRRKQYTYAWTGLKDSQIAQNLATLTDRETGRKRFPLPIVVSDTAVRNETPEDYIAQENQYDIDFLLMRARRRGYVVYVENENNEERLYFGPSQNVREQALRRVTYQLQWGRSLMEFKPTLTSANQVRSVTVNGWNRRTRRPISEKVDLNDRRLNRNRDLYEVLQKCDPREEIVVSEPVFTPQQARERAIAILSDRQKEQLKCTATTIGLPDLRAGQTVEILGIGVRFSGIYFITDTTHTLNSGGYITRFGARRENPSTGGA